MSGREISDYNKKSFFEPETNKVKSLIKLITIFSTIVQVIIKHQNIFITWNRVISI